MPPYEARFPKGKSVRIASRSTLEEQRRDWEYHDPITDEHLKHAGTASRIKSVGFYHGGDVLYTLENLPHLT
ncbi:MAG TPA: hypothetical protein VNR20_05010, partial [Terriglobales bacterium]|nr:hypothetical protein [Terriglobales bacterium]